MDAERLAALKNKVFEAYKAKTPKSQEMYERACSALQGGVCASTRFFDPYPFYTTHGKGSRLYDVDGNEYIDFFNCAGPLLLGHCHPEVMETVRRELERGLLIQQPELVIECAELINDLVPCAERVRFVSTGLEANLYAVRVARAYTGKNKIIKFYGQLHGMDDQFMVGIRGISNDTVGAGIPAEHLKNTIMLRYNDIEAVKDMLDQDRDIAGVILDPQCHTGGIWPPTREYLNELRQITGERGVILIFDEVLTGFRLAPGGAQEYFGIKPDLVALATGMGNGAKIGAVAGKEHIMNAMRPGGDTATASGKKVAMHGGTYADGTIGLAATIASLKVYKKLGETGEYQRLFKKAEVLKKGLENVFQEKEIPLRVRMLGPTLRMFLTELEPSLDQYSKLDRTILHLFQTSLIPENVWLTNPTVQTIYLSFAHTEEDIKTVTEAAKTSLNKYNFHEVL